MVVAEFLGYWLHVLLHSNKIVFLSKNHMIHHLVIYGPKKPFLTDTYQTALIEGRPGIAGIGLEWLMPAVLIIGSIWIIMWLLNIPLHLILIFLGVAIVWELVIFNYMHDALHIRNFWMEHNKYFSKWFLKIRENHEIHHMEIDNKGRMNKNYGICFFFFDHLFGTFEKKFVKFNEEGYETAKRIYSYIYEKVKHDTN